jgi:DNA-directed RNA polymerase subunit N (RpoN/RPB10)
MRLRIPFSNKVIKIKISAVRLPRRCLTCGKRLVSPKATHCTEHRIMGRCRTCGKVLGRKGNYCQNHRKDYLKSPEYKKALKRKLKLKAKAKARAVKGKSRAVKGKSRAV